MLPNEVGQNRETDEEHDEDCVVEGFQSWGMVFDPTKAVYILKTIFQYFYYVVFRIHRFLKYVILYNE